MVAGVAELAVAHEPGEQLAGGLLGVELVERLLDVLLEQEARLHLEKGGDEEHELRGRVEVELLALGETHDVLGDDARDAHLPDVDLVLEDEGDEQVERPVEDVEVELEPFGGGDGRLEVDRRRAGTHARHSSGWRTKDGMSKSPS